MDTLREHTLIYDDECPACVAYTQLFVDSKMITKEGRQPYGKMLNQLKEKVDWVRASNEIALVNHRTGEVSYGIDSLFKVIEKRMPILRILFRLKAFRWLMAKLYFFISYNRKVIIPGKTNEVCSTCAPSMNYPYRISYLIFAWLLTSLVLTNYMHLLQPLVAPSTFGREFLFCGGQILFQGIIVALFFRQQLMEYLGHLMTVSLAGAIMLSPILLLSNWINNPWLAIAYFMVVVGLMLYEHSRRLRILGLAWQLSASWLLYRLLLLTLIF